MIFIMEFIRNITIFFHCLYVVFVLHATTAFDVTPFILNRYTLFRIGVNVFLYSGSRLGSGNGDAQLVS